MSDLITVAGFCIVCLMIGFVLGANVADAHAHKEAVKNHVAHYAITNDATGETEFQWNKQPEKP